MPGSVRPAAPRRATRPVEWLVAVAGGLALAGGLTAVLRGDGADPGSRVILADPQSAPARTPAPVPARAPVPAPALVPVPAARPAPALPVAAVVPLPAGLTLRGVVERSGGGAAIIETGDGRQRLVRQGGEISPGVRLETVGRGGVVLAAGPARQALDFGAAAAGPAPAAAAIAAASAAARPGDLAASASDYRLGLRPRKVDGRTTGYTVADISRLALLRRAGLRVGDVVTMVNGSIIASDEKLLEMPAEVAGANQVEIMYERQGVLNSVTLPLAR